MLRIFLTVIVCSFATPTSKTIIDGITRVYDSESKIESDGYTSETHHVVTTDGYILEINRIPKGRNEEQSETEKPVVFLMHGLQASAASYFTIGPEHSIAYNLADAGFDVWMGNARGVLNSRNHITLNPDDENDKNIFFDFTFEEIATIDVPTMIDYVLEVTGREKLHYIGHSQGGTVFLILNSMMPEYNDKFISVHLLAGVGYQNHFPNATTLSTLALGTDFIYALGKSRGLVELFGPSWNDIEACDSTTENCGLHAIIEILVNHPTFPQSTIHHYFLNRWCSITKRFMNEFFPRSTRIWNEVPASVFPTQYNLGAFKKRAYSYIKAGNTPIKPLVLESRVCDDDHLTSCARLKSLAEFDVIAGCALKQFAHFGQNIRDRRFRRWNYGLANFVHYGSRSPPEYNLSLITANVTMHYALADKVLGEGDVLAMAANMPNSSVRKVARDDFSHMDFTMARDAKELVTDYIIDAIKNYN